MWYTYSLLCTLNSCTSTLYKSSMKWGGGKNLWVPEALEFLSEAFSFFCSNVLVFQDVKPNLHCFLVFSIRGLAWCDTSGSSGSSAPCWSLGGNSRGGHSLSSGATRRCRTAARPREKPGRWQSYWLYPTSASGEERRKMYRSVLMVFENTHTNRVLHSRRFCNLAFTQWFKLVRGGKKGMKERLKEIEWRNNKRREEVR